MNSPLEIPGCLGWLETDSDGTPIDHVKADTGHDGEWIIFPIDDNRGIILYFYHTLADDDRAGLKEWLEAQKEGKDDVSSPDIGEDD